MKILFAGGGTGGHFYPIIAVARALRDMAEREKISRLDLTMMSDDPYDIDLLRQEGIVFKKAPAGKLRRYFSLRNITDSFKTLVGILRAMWNIFFDIPDVVFAKGGYASFPALMAARFLRIPVIIHESDAVPGAVNRWAGKFARRIAISFPESAEYFPKDKTAVVGNPIRRKVIGGSADEAVRVFGLETGVKTILILGGSQGSQKINDVVLNSLSQLVESFNVVHQTGKNNFETVKLRSSVILEKSDFKKRYHPEDFLSEGDLRNLSKVADLVISRAGGGAIFEIAAWGVPSILIPLKNSAADHQRKNAYAYVKSGAAGIIEEDNLTPHVFLSEIIKLMGDDKKLQDMRRGAQSFAKIDAAKDIASAIMDLALEHAE